MCLYIFKGWWYFGTYYSAFAALLSAFIYCSSKTLITAMATCISEAVTSCPIGRREITLKISTLLQSVFQGTICPGSTVHDSGS